MMFLFRLMKIRYVGAILLIAIIASGNGEAALSITRTTFEATAQAIKVVGKIYAASENTAKIINKKEPEISNSIVANSKPLARENSNAEPGSYKISLSAEGKPVSWCTSKIEVVINSAQAPAGARKDLETALRKMSAITGVRFDVIGESGRIPDKKYHLTEGSPYPPVLIAWAFASQTDMLNPRISASAVANPAETEVGVQYVTGSLAINIDHDVLYSPGFGAGMSRGNLYLHELGHVMGLAHVDDMSMLMSSTIGTKSPDGFAEGDRRGLKALGCKK